MSFDFGVQYVHPDGSDTNTGFDQAEPKATIEAAVGDLGDEGGTVILASKQRHDIGDGLVVDRRATVSFKGLGRANRTRPSASRPSNAPLIYTSTGAATMFDLSTPAESVNCYGWEWRDVDFEISPTTTRVFEAPSVNTAQIESCGFFHAATDAVQAPFQVMHAYNATPASNDDSSWWRVINNYVRGGQLIHVTGYGSNQWVIKENIVFPINQTDPCIYMENGHRHVIRDNNLEGSQTSAGIYLKAITASRLDGNAGEATSPFIVLDKSHANLISDMGIIAPAGKTFLRLLGSSSNNVVILSVVTQAFNLYNTAWLDDQTGQDGNWFIVPSTNKDRVKISLPGLKISAADPAGVVRGKTGDVHIKNSSPNPPFISYKVAFDHQTSGWRGVALGLVDSGGVGKKNLIGPN